MSESTIDPHSIPLAEIDVSDPTLFENDTWGPLFERLRREDPVHYQANSPFGPFWSITKFDDIMEIERNYEVFSSHGSIVIGDVAEEELDISPGFIAMDPPQHDQQRKVAQGVVAPRNLMAMEPLIRQRVQSILDDLPTEVALIGFAGAPFTLAAYLVEGQGSRSFSKLKRMLHREPEVLQSLLARLADLTVDYLNAQIEAGAQVVQLFDTWAGLLSPAEYRTWVLPGHQEIASRVKRTEAPLILYVNDGSHVVGEMAEAGADVISLDWRVDLAAAAARVGQRVSLQGNLDPCALHGSRERIFESVRELARAAAPARGHILNLGHGCLPETPVEGVQAFTDAARALGNVAS